MLTLTYIYHDCFVAETPEATIVFDYWRDGLPDYNDASRGSSTDVVPRFLKSIRTDIPLYILVSHHHKDHFTRNIFRWKDAASEVRFIISRDTEKAVRYLLRPDSTYTGDRPRLDQVVVLRPGETFEDEVITVKAFGSTDIGNSYIVETGGKRLFHAGDLNAWIWKDESTLAEIKAALRDYNAVLDSISESCGVKIDIAMCPVDSRIGTDYWEGAKIFVHRFDVKVFVPMHFGLGDDAADALKKAADACRFDYYANPERGIYVALQHPYSSLAMT